MNQFVLSKHAIEQIKLRGLYTDVVEAVLAMPDRIVEEADGQLIYQAVIQRDNKDYLLRVFVNGNKIPNLVKTVYLTSKMDKYQ